MAVDPDTLGVTDDAPTAVKPSGAAVPVTWTRAVAALDEPNEAVQVLAVDCHRPAAVGSAFSVVTMGTNVVEPDGW